jgi:hypothetical protein
MARRINLIKGECEKLFERIINIKEKYKNKLGNDAFKQLDNLEQSKRFFNSVEEFEDFYINLVSLFITNFRAGGKKKGWSAAGGVHIKHKWPVYKKQFDEFIDFMKDENNHRISPNVEKKSSEEIEKENKEINKTLVEITKDFEQDINKLDKIFHEFWFIFEGRRQLNIQFGTHKFKQGVIGETVLLLAQTHAAIANLLKVIVEPKSGDWRNPPKRFDRRNILEEKIDDIIKDSKIIYYIRNASLGSLKENFRNGMEALQELFETIEFITLSIAHHGKLGDLKLRRGLFSGRRRRIEAKSWPRIEEDLRKFSYEMKRVIVVIRNFGPQYGDRANRLTHLVDFHDQQREYLSKIIHQFAESVK